MDNFTKPLKKVSSSVDHFKEKATNLMTGVSPSEYNAALTDIINYLACKPKSTFLAGLLKSGILVAIISVEFLGAPMHRSQI